MPEQIGEARELEEDGTGRWRCDRFVLKYPGGPVGDEDRVEAGGEGGIDIGLWAVADHPGVARVQAVMVDDGAVAGLDFLIEYLDLRKAGAEALSVRACRAAQCGRLW